MPSDKNTRRQRHQAQVKTQPGKAVRGAQSTEFVKKAGYRKSEFIGGKKYYTPMSTDPTSSGAGGDVTNITVSGSGSVQGAVLADGTVPFNSTQVGISPTEASHLATKGYIDDSEFITSSLKNGTGSGDIVKSITTGTLNYKSIKQGGSITVTNNTDDITIAGGGLTSVNNSNWSGSNSTVLAVGNGGTGGYDAATARTSLNVDQAGTDNSTNVTLTGTPDYITISGQVITRGAIVLTTDVSGNLPDGNIASSSTWNAKLDSALGNGGSGSVSLVKTSNDSGTTQLRNLKGTGSITVAVDGSEDHINIGGGGLTSVALASNVTGVLPIANGGTNSTTAANALAALGGAALGHNHSGTYDNYSSWTAKDHDGTTYTITSGDTLWIKEGTGIDVNFTADDELTITNTAPDVDHEHWDGSSSGLDAATGRASLGLGTAATQNTGYFATSSHNHSAGDINSGTLAEGRGGTGVTSYAELKTALSLGSAAYADLGTGGSNAAYGNHTHTSLGTLTLSGELNFSSSTGSILINHEVSEADAWFFRENATNWGLYWKNANANHKTFGGYTSVGAEFVGMKHGSATNAVHINSGWGGTDSDTYATWMLSNYSGVFWNASHIYCEADIYAYYSSDPILKENKVLIENPLDKISKLGGYTFDWKESAKEHGGHLTGHDYGVMADEVEDIFPEMVQTRGDGIRAVKYEKLVPVLIEAVKELKGELDAIKHSI